MIKYLIFDNDGVLVNTQELHYLATLETFREFDVELSVEQYIELCLVKGSSLFNLLRQKNVNETLISYARGKRDLIYKELILQRNIIIPGVKNSLQKLRRHFQMGIVTSTQLDVFLTEHKYLGLLKYFNFYITIEEYFIKKPSPDGYLTALKKFNIQNSEAVVIEDTVVGALSADRAAIKCIIIKNSMNERIGFANRIKVFDNIKIASDFLISSKYLSKQIC